MTFIASVIAKKGVAIIADSLVTSMERIIDYDTFLNFFTEKAKVTPVGEIKIEPAEIVSLFESKPSHTKDYEEKLFQYDSYTAITTAGAASINGKKIEYIIKALIDKNKKDKGYSRKKIETKVKEFVEHLNKQTIIYKVDIIPCSKTDVKDDSFNCVSFKKMDGYYRVVCDGQNRISERILFGEVDFFIDITPKIIKKVIEKLKIPEKDIPLDFIQNFMHDAKSFLPIQFWDDMKINRLADLSLQQAVDLASLLMKIEIRFQKYTENIPTVGGVIKLAIINKEGFKFISGNEILKSENLN